ncbi:MAG: hypothetical protein EU548_02685 [Promethearchaeota archaeon]|nr:MAG: hypothetical protein EU548_02685 [Candidatus Lokiarchaeota archaeon]
MVDLLTTILGITIALIATTCFNLGIILQKRGLRECRDIKIEEGVRSIVAVFKELCKNKPWFIGTALGIIGMIPYAIAMGMVGIVVVQPIMSVGLIIFFVSAIKILKEKVTYFEVIPIILLISVPLFIGLAQISDPYIDLYEFVIPFFVFFFIMLALSAISYYFSQRKRGTRMEGIFIMFIGAIFYSLGAFFTNILTQALIDSNIFIPFFWEIIFGIFWFEYAHLWAFLGFWGLAIFNVASVIFIQSALQRSKAVFIVPIQNSITFIVPIIAGLFVFNQRFTNNIFFIITIIIVLISTIILSKYEASIQNSDNYS